MHKFDPSKLEKLDSPSRLELFDPEKVLREFGLRQGMTAFDIGTGAGFYLPYLSKAVGESGRVLAFDVQKEAVEYAKRKTQELGLTNVEVLLSSELSLPVEDSVTDFVYMAFVFHELENPVEFMKEVSRASKQGALMCIIDWTKEDRDKGPPKEEVFSEWEMGLMIEEAGLRAARAVKVGNYAFGFYVLKPG
ncbi:MAG: class I SAM-dependent methyltransferase [Aquificaceae bacterium]|nr:class I SAM-dependent methyltransferase [Aquificaceae bacterium]MDW8236962.1 class I SAM-dependent methyltransferase [Aquificaceae bacterium]